jgi:hypothetical protein
MSIKSRALGVLLAGLLLGPSLAHAQTNVLFVDSQPGDPIGGGVQRTYTLSSGTVSVVRDTFNNHIRISVNNPTYTFWWDLAFGAPGDAVLAAGSYAPAVRFGSPAIASLYVSDSGRSCSRLTGRFDVVEIAYANDGTVQRFAADLEQHCEDAAPALFAAIRINSTIVAAVPFGGAYPHYELQLLEPSGGTITSSGGLACGSSGSACSTIFGSATSVELMVTADPGKVFTGWTGACHGGTTTTLNVNSLKTCSATFEPEPPADPRTVLATYSAPGDYIGQGKQEIYSNANSVWTARSLQDGNTVELTVTGLGDRAASYWRLTLQAPPGQELTPGTYASVVRFRSGLLAGLDVSADSRACGSVTGRFDVLDAAFASDGTVERFAADIELHCEDSGPALLAAVRYRTTAGGLVPFGTTTPRYELSIAANEHGTVRGTGIDCGPRSTSCVVVFDAPTAVTLTASAEPGYLFTGWTGSCIDTAATMTINVNGTKTCGAAFQEVVPSQPRTVVVFDGSAGDPIGLGRLQAFTPANAVFFVTRNAANGVSISINTARASWRVELSPPSGELLTAKLYAPATRYPFTSFAGFDISGDGRGCNEETGRFLVREIETAPDGTITRLAADIEQHCEDFSPALFAAVRYNSDLDARPFDGVYPRFELALTEPAHGQVTGEGLTCGGGATTCNLTFDASRIIALTARPEPGYIFTGWTGACNGGQAMTVKVNTVKECEASFAPDPPVVRQTVLYWESTRGDYIGQGDIEIYSGENSRWTVTPTGNGNGVQLTIASVGDTAESKWTLDFRAPLGSLLTVGTYPEVARASFRTTTAGLDVSGNGRGCNIVAGYFTVHEIAIDPGTGSVTAFAVDFEQHCETLSAPPLIGTLRYNSSAALPLRSVSLSSDLILPVLATIPITWTASAHPGVGVEYSFWRFDEGSGWSLVQPYSQNPVYKWTPTFAEVGTHSLQVWARKTGSTAAYEVWSGQTFSIKSAPAPSLSLSVTRSPAFVGAPVVFSATASGGRAPYQFQFWRLDADGWHMVQDYSWSSTYLWIPAAADVGAHALQVWVRNAESMALYDAYRGLSFEVRVPDGVRVTLTSSIGLSAPAGRPISWSATATGGVSPLLYRFWRLDSDGWKMVRDYSINNAYTWTTTAADVGEHAIQVWVRSIGSQEAYEGYTGMSITITAPTPVTITSLTATPTLPAPAGTSITWATGVDGGVAPLEYQFWRLDADGWHLARGYSTSASYTWTPSVSDVGDHAIQVWVRSAGSTAAYEAWHGATFAVTEPVIAIVALFTNFATSPPVGQLVEFTAATGVFTVR